MARVVNHIQLISLVQSRRCLYDTRDRSHIANSERTENWGEISEIMSIPVKQCRITWQNLRAKFIKEHETRASTWEHYNAMQFLIPFLQMEAANANQVDELAVRVPASQATSDDDSDDSNENESIRSSEDHFQTADTRENATNEATADDTEVSEMLARMSVSSTSRAQNLDENDLFLEAIAKKMKILPHEVKLNIQERLLQDVNTALRNNRIVPNL